MRELNEVLWEFTLQCNKNCQYCGSKSVLNKNAEKNIDRHVIVKNIIQAKAKQVTITGGQPSVLMSSLVSCVHQLSQNNVTVKILTNGNLFNQNDFSSLNNDVQAFGLSINEQRDIEFAKTIFSKIPFYKTTMITNFGIHNFNMFEKLSKFAVNFATWQVQLTMGNNYQLDLKDIEKLKKYLEEFRNKKMVPIIEADNLICGKCGAGTHGCSICWNGDVIPCLSYRSWKNDLDVQGNVLEKSLKEIWEKRFEFYRDRQFFPCCKCITGIELLNKKKEENLIDILKGNGGNTPLRTQPQIKSGVTFVYGVNIRQDENWVVYGVNISNQPTSLS